MMDVGVLKLTPAGREILADAMMNGRSVKPKFFKVSKQDVNIDDPNISASSISWWIQKDISLYNKISANKVEFVLIVEPPEAIDYARVFGLFLEDGTMFAVAKQPYGGLPPAIRQVAKNQLEYKNASNGLINFEYIPFSETEQDLTMLDISLTLGAEIEKNSELIGLIKSKQDRS